MCSLFACTKILSKSVILLLQGDHGLSQFCKFLHQGGDVDLQGRSGGQSHGEGSELLWSSGVVGKGFGGSWGQTVL